MIIIAGSLSFDPSDRDDVLASLAEVTEASRRDPGCLEYFWGEDLEAPNTFRFFECWESQELLDSHLAQPHEIAFGERNLTRITGATASFFDASPTASSMPAAGTAAD
jgi:quinol monooxygenase YgiN